MVYCAGNNETPNSHEEAHLHHYFGGIVLLHGAFRIRSNGRTLPRVWSPIHGSTTVQLRDRRTVQLLLGQHRRAYPSHQHHWWGYGDASQRLHDGA